VASKRATSGTIFNPSLKHLLPDPLVLKDMGAAVARVAAALEAGEAVAVFGDYDVDGSASSALLSDFSPRLACRHGSTFPTA